MPDSGIYAGFTWIVQENKKSHTPKVLITSKYNKERTYVIFGNHMWPFNQNFPGKFENLDIGLKVQPY